MEEGYETPNPGYYPWCIFVLCQTVFSLEDPPSIPLSIMAEPGGNLSLKDAFSSCRCWWWACSSPEVCLQWLFLHTKINSLLFWFYVGEADCMWCNSSNVAMKIKRGSVSNKKSGYKCIYPYIWMMHEVKYTITKTIWGTILSLTGSELNIKYLHVHSGVQVCVQSKQFMVPQYPLHQLNLSMNSLVVWNGISDGKSDKKDHVFKG